MLNNHIGNTKDSTMEALLNILYPYHSDDEGRMRDLLVTKFLSQGEKALKLESREDCISESVEEEDSQIDEETEDFSSGYFSQSQTVIEEESHELEFEEQKNELYFAFDILRTNLELNFT